MSFILLLTHFNILLYLGLLLCEYFGINALSVGSGQIRSYQTQRLHETEVDVFHVRFEVVDLSVVESFLIKDLIAYYHCLLLLHLCHIPLELFLVLQLNLCHYVLFASQMHKQRAFNFSHKVFEFHVYQWPLQTLFQSLTRETFQRLRVVRIQQNEEVFVFIDVGAVTLYLVEEKSEHVIEDLVEVWIRKPFHKFLSDDPFDLHVSHRLHNEWHEHMLVKDRLLVLEYINFLPQRAVDHTNGKALGNGQALDDTQFGYKFLGSFDLHQIGYIV